MQYLWREDVEIGEWNHVRIGEKEALVNMNW
jgi:hypothetical protein